jgi:K+-sensing histidine kinase KdpD
MENTAKYDDILAMVTHDLKSPMAAIICALDYLGFEDITKKEKKEALKAGKNASKEMIYLINNIVAMAKLEAGKESIEKEKITNLYEHFIDIVDTFKYEARAKRIDYNINIPSKLPIVDWDINKLHYHVFNNIISNAMKFTPSDGTGKIKVIVDSNIEKETIEISIKDNGIGIPLEKQNSIFSKYETINKEKKYKGNGLGLYNAFLFIKEHNGNIEVIKGIDEKGVGFKVTLPFIG